MNAPDARAWRVEMVPASGCRGLQACRDRAARFPDQLKTTKNGPIRRIDPSWWCEVEG